MGYLFLWLEAMASAYLLVAVVFSFSGRLKKWQALWPGLTALLITVPAIAATAFAGFLFHFNVRPQWLFPYTLSWTLLFTTMSWILIRWGRQPTGATPRSAHWSRSKLSGALFMVLVFQWFTMNILDNAAKLEAVAAQASALNRVQSLFPGPPPPNQNAAELYAQAIREMGGKPNWARDAATNPAFDPTSDTVKKFLQEKRKAIALIKQATRKPNFYQPFFFSYDLKGFRVPPFKTAAYQLALEARIHARSGRITAALENMAAIERIVEHAHQSPRLINTLLLIVNQKIKKDALEIIIAESPRGSKFPVLLPLTTQDRITQTMNRAMTEARSWSAFNMSDLLIHRPSLNPFLYLNAWDSDANRPKTLEGMGQFLFNVLYRIFFLHDDLVSHEEFWEKVQEFTEKPYYESGEKFKKWQNEIGENLSLGLYSYSHPLIHQYFKRVPRGQTDFRLTQLARATAAYRSDHGKYPRTLEALVPKYIMAVPIDPFTGDPLKMKAVDGGWILYGVGPDLKDDQGAAYDSETEEGDIAFYFGSAYTEHRLKPAIEKMKSGEEE